MASQKPHHYEAREHESTDTNPNRKGTPKRLPRHDIAITDCEPSDEGEIDRITHRPALDEASQQAEGNLKRQNYRQNRPGETNGVSKRHEKASLSPSCRPFHISTRFCNSCHRVTTITR
jgi:hypothetical protein